MRRRLEDLGHLFGTDRAPAVNAIPSSLLLNSSVAKATRGRYVLETNLATGVSETRRGFASVVQVDLREHFVSYNVCWSDLGGPMGRCKTCNGR